MKKSIQKGEVLSFRLPVGTPDSVIRQLNRWKEQGDLAKQLISLIHLSITVEEKGLYPVTLFLPSELKKETKAWLETPHSKELLGALVFQFIHSPLSSLQDLQKESPLQFKQTFLEEKESEKFKVETEFHNRLANSLFDEEE